MKRSSVSFEKTFSQTNEDKINEIVNPEVSIVSNFASSMDIPQFASTNLDENGYVFDGVKVEIEDVDNTSLSNITTQSLKRCKKQVLKHYYSLLCFVFNFIYFETSIFILLIFCVFYRLVGGPFLKNISMQCQLIVTYLTFSTRL